MTEHKNTDKSTIVLGLRPVTIEDVISISRGEAEMRLDNNSEFYESIDRNARQFAAQLSRGERVYGVNTGFGESCLNSVAERYVRELPFNLVRFHGCGTGDFLKDNESAAVMVCSLASLTTSWSAVRPVVIERLCDLLNHRIFPRIPSQGSVGASGDLTPLSYVASALIGEREVSYRGQIMPAAQALSEAGLTPIEFHPKESLTIMNGTSVMTALCCLAYERARRLSRLTAAITAMSSDVMRGNRGHFDDRIFASKPHPGQRACARWIRDDIEYSTTHRHDGRIQDRYSVRCAPHVVGVLLDSLTWARPWLETEMNGSDFNPLIDPDTGEALHGGNFYGGHACFVADSMKNAVANVADLLDRQLALLCSPVTSNGLPENLVGRIDDDRSAHHGFKAMQIAASSLAAEALKLTMPASVFSRSTESHNQDKVSMGTIASRDCLRIIELTETVAAICTLAVSQAVDLRQKSGCHSRAIAINEAVRTRVPFNDRDRRQDNDIIEVLHMIQNDLLPIGEIDFA